jgi:hypothetical protein
MKGVDALSFTKNGKVNSSMFKSSFGYGSSMFKSHSSMNRRLQFSVGEKSTQRGSRIQDGLSDLKDAL